MQGQDTFSRAHGRRHRAEFLRLRVRQLRHGERHTARGRRAAAADQLRRHLHGHPAGGLRHTDGAAFSPQTHRILSAVRTRRASQWPSAPGCGGLLVRACGPVGRARHPARQTSRSSSRRWREAILLRQAAAAQAPARRRRASRRSSKRWTGPPRRPSPGTNIDRSSSPKGASARAPSSGSRTARRSIKPASAAACRRNTSRPSSASKPTTAA